MSYRPTPFLLASAGVHAAGALALALAPGRWQAVAGTLFANHVAIAAVSLWPQSRLLGPNLSRLPRAEQEIALTFDDGPDPAVTPRVLDLLDERGARASFFCIGRQVAAHPALAAEIAHRGHRVENHTWSHPNSFSCYGPGAQRREIDRAQEAIARAAGRLPRWFRAPAGFRNLFLERELEKAGLGLASWTRRGYDTVSRSPDAVAGRLLRGLAAGDILLLHDGNAAGGWGGWRGAPVILEVLPRLLDEIAARELRPVPLPG